MEVSYRKRASFIVVIISVFICISNIMSFTLFICYCTLQNVFNKSPRGIFYNTISIATFI